MTVKAEARKERLHDQKLANEVESSLLAVLGIRVKVELVEEGTLPRSDGKARRVIDLRPKD
jgi:phenylacetate-CoA ligase